MRIALRLSGQRSPLSCSQKEQHLALKLCHHSQTLRAGKGTGRSSDRPVQTGPAIFHRPFSSSLLPRQKQSQEPYEKSTQRLEEFPQKFHKLPRQPPLPDRPARTRFAPSPTGYLHIGGLRTALFSYLLAKRTHGEFLVRIEDTDQKRLVPDAEEKLLADLQWAGLQWDEGPGIGGPFGPYKQSERTAIYQQHAAELLDQGAAYRCFCTQQTDGVAYVTS